MLRPQPPLAGGTPRAFSEVPSPNKTRGFETAPSVHSGSAPGRAFGAGAGAVPGHRLLQQVPPCRKGWRPAGWDEAQSLWDLEHNLRKLILADEGLLPARV